MKLLSLFSGIGAFEKSLTNIGVDCELVGFSEIDKWAIESYCAIHGIDKGLNLGDISEIKDGELPSEVDIITYGFPCQDISIAGNQQGITNDTRSGLLYEAERIIEYTKPKYAIAENVKNLVGKRHKKEFDEMLERLDSYGYNNYWQVLNAKDYGIPQNRERVFIISIRKDVDKGTFGFPCASGITVKLQDVLEEKVSQKYTISDTLWTGHQKRKREHKKRGNGFGYSLFNRDSAYTSTLSARYYKDGSEALIEQKNKNPRKLNPLECWRLMGFDDIDYWKARKRLEVIFYNGKDRSDSQMYKQAGNSIVVNVLEEIFKGLFK